LARRRQVSTWQRWARKLPHNRVLRVPTRDGLGRVIGYGAPVPVPEPPLPSENCRLVTRPSGLLEVELAGPSGKDVLRLQKAYRLARHPKPTLEEVEIMPVTLAEVQAWRVEIGVL
jgi:hypothetical protein